MIDYSPLTYLMTVLVLKGENDMLFLCYLNKEHNCI